MEGGSIISRAPSPANIGNYEVSIVANGARAAYIVIPGGSSVSIERAANFSNGDSNSIKRQWATIQRTRKADDGLLSLQQLAERSKGKIIYTENFNADIKQPNEMIRIARGEAEKVVPRWMFAAYYAENASGRSSSEQAWKEVGVVPQGSDSDLIRTFASLKEAQAVIDNGGALNEVPARFLDEVLKRSNTFERTDIGGGKTLIVRKNGERLIRYEADGKTALADRMAMDFGRALGVAVPDARLAGTGSRRAILLGTAESAANNGKFSNEPLSSVKPEDLARIALVDYVTGRDGRNPGSISVIDNGDQIIPVVDAIGTKPNMTAAIVRKPDTTLSAEDGGSWLRQYTGNMTTSNRKVMIEMFDSLLERASQFDWPAYMTRLGLDGDLSPADKQHLDVLKNLVESRLAQLRTSRKTVIRIIGGGNA
jgi:hypothetical protein